MKVLELTKIGILAGTPLINLSCAIDARDDNVHHYDSGHHYENGHHDVYTRYEVVIEDRWKKEVKECEDHERKAETGELLCVEKEDRVWASNCNTSDCQAVPVNGVCRSDFKCVLQSIIQNSDRLQSCLGP